MEQAYQDTPKLRQSVIDVCLHMSQTGLNSGTSGNVSVRVETGLLVTPSGVPYEKMRKEMLQVIPTQGSPRLRGDFRPTTEWRFHQAVLAARPDLNAVVHAHPAYATAVAVQRRPIPACHYMVAAFGGNDVPLVDYSLFGSSELAAAVAAVMADRTGCLMANHGVLTAGETLERALWRMEELNHLARIFLLSHMGAAPFILTDADMADVIPAFASYGLA